MRDALKARDPITAAALRSVVSAIANAEAVDGPNRSTPRLGVGSGEAARRELSERDVIEILRAEIGERVESADEYERLGRADLATRLRDEAAVLEPYLDHA